MGMPPDRASTIGQSAAACWTVRLAWDLKFGSLKPSRYLDPAGMAWLSEPPPQSMGTYSTLGAPASGACAAQLYHQVTPGKVSEGASAAVGAALAATPRLQGRLEASAAAASSAESSGGLAASAGATPASAGGSRSAAEASATAGARIGSRSFEPHAPVGATVATRHAARSANRPVRGIGT